MTRVPRFYLRSHNAWLGQTCVVPPQENLLREVAVCCCLEARVPLLCFAQSSSKAGIRAEPGRQRIAGDVWRIEEATANRCLEMMQRTLGLPQEGRKVDEPVVPLAVHHHVLLECVQHLRHRIAIATSNTRIRAAKGCPHTR